MTLVSLGDSGHTQIVAGSVTGSSGTDAAITSQDGSLTLTVGGTGDFTITFGSAFLSAPVVVGNVVDATYAATDGPHVVEIAAVAATDVQLRIVDAGGSAADGAVADLDFHFMAIGKRNR